jgi:hypothetical protein
LATCCIPDWQPGERSDFAVPADYQSATQQTASLCYKGIYHAPQSGVALRLPPQNLAAVRSFHGKEKKAPLTRGSQPD